MSSKPCPDLPFWRHSPAILSRHHLLDTVSIHLVCGHLDFGRSESPGNCAGRSSCPNQVLLGENFHVRPGCRQKWGRGGGSNSDPRKGKIVSKFKLLHHKVRALGKEHTRLQEELRRQEDRLTVVSSSERSSMDRVLFLRSFSCILRRAIQSLSLSRHSASAFP